MGVMKDRVRQNTKLIVAFSAFKFFPGIYNGDRFRFTAQALNTIGPTEAL